MGISTPKFARNAQQHYYRSYHRTSRFDTHLNHEIFRRQFSYCWLCELSYSYRGKKDEMLRETKPVVFCLFTTSMT